jgi:hypothetical protein
MAVMRQGVEHQFVTEVAAGRYKDGDIYTTAK